MSKLITLALLILAGCNTAQKCEPQVKFVDIQTYKDWGTTRLVPIGRRPIPTEAEICSNPLWMNSSSCFEYRARHERH